MSLPVLQLRIKAQPRSTYRERYSSELGRQHKRSQRFILADSNPDQLNHPTLAIPQQWNDQHLYICVTLVTIRSEPVSVICVHPYPIDTYELNVIKDVKRNTLYFPISEKESKKGEKSFRIIRNKLIQFELRNYGQLRLFNSDERDVQRIDNSNDARKLIDLYQLGKSQLVFSLAKLIPDNPLPITYTATSIFSNIMSAITAVTATNDNDLSIRCAPKRGSWEGGDDVLMVIPKLTKRKPCEIVFEHSSMNEIDPIPIEFIDTKTIAFTTPPCAISAIENREILIPMVVIQNGEEIARVDFLYQSYE